MEVLDDFFEFTGRKCGEVHKGMPSLAAERPAAFYDVADEERDWRCAIGTDNCVIDGKFYFVRGCLDVPVHGRPEPFTWGVWVSLSQASYEQFEAHFHDTRRSHMGPFFGWLSTQIRIYPATENLKTRARLRDNGLRPLIELEPTEHLLAVEQREGISPERLAEIYEMLLHDHDA